MLSEAVTGGASQASFPAKMLVSHSAPNAACPLPRPLKKLAIRARCNAASLPLFGLASLAPCHTPPMVPDAVRTPWVGCVALHTGFRTLDSAREPV